jgi:nicotinamide riboside transporter PnuC
MSQGIEKLRSDIKWLKLLLIVLTFVQVGYGIIVFSDIKLWIQLDTQYHAYVLVAIFQYATVGVFIWFVWRKMPGERKPKTNSTLMIIFLGIIGMWLWLPNKRELNKLEDTD